MAVDENCYLLLTVPQITGRYYTVQFLDGWRETLANIKRASGYGTRFWKVYVDFKTKKRTPKLSAMWHREAAARNAAVRGKRGETRSQCGRTLVQSGRKTIRLLRLNRLPSPLRCSRITALDVSEQCPSGDGCRVAVIFLAVYAL